MIKILILALPAMVCAVIALLLTLNVVTSRNKPQVKLLAFMVVSMLLYVAHFIFFNDLIDAIPFSDTIYSFCNPAVYPLFFIYVEELTLKRPNRLHQLLYLLPAIVCFVAVGWLYLMMDQQETAFFIEQYLYHNKFSSLEGFAWWQGVAHWVVKLVFALEIPPVLYFGWKYITRYNQVVENNYSDTDDKNVSSVKSLLLLLAITSVVSFVCNVIGRYMFSESEWLVTIPVIVFSLLLLLIGHVGLNQRFYAYHMVMDLDSVEEYSEEYSNDLSTRLLRLINEERLYLRPNLKINDLAKLLNTNRNYIYNAINVEMGISFSEFINHKRIDYAVRLMEKTPNVQLSEVAMKSGFSSVSTFYRNFKLFKKCAPSDFQQEITEGRKRV